MQAQKSAGAPQSCNSRNIYQLSRRGYADSPLTDQRHFAPRQRSREIQTACLRPHTRSNKFRVDVPVTWRVWPQVAQMKGKEVRKKPTLTRRQFLFAGGTATAWAVLGGPAVAAAARSGVEAYTLRVGYSDREVGPFRLRTRTYNSSLPGPLMVTRPGHTLRVKLINTLPADPPAAVPPGIDPLNNPHAFNTTNLHVHGLQVIPHLFQPLGTINPAAPLITVGSGQSFDYAFTLPGDHPSGLYWYHPHYHGSAGVQVVNGMAGLILVKGPIDDVPEIAAARDELLAIENLKINPLDKSGTKWGLEPLAYLPASAGGYSPESKVELITANGRLVMIIDRRGAKPAASRQAPPVYTMRPGEVMRLRILNGTDGIFLPLALPGFEVYVIGQDGINLLKPEKAGDDLKSAIRMAPGNRNEVLIRAPMNPGKGVLRALAQMPSAPDFLSEAMGEMMATPEIAIAAFEVSGAPKPMAIPEKLPIPTREYPLISDAEIVARRTVTFSMKTGSKRIIDGFEYLVDGQLYQEGTVAPTVKLGSAEEWRIVNNSDGIHPFHIHVNSFEVMGLPSDPNYHRLHDTIWLPPFSSITMRTRFKTWKGKSVYHCHVLPHEDSAMIKNFLIS
jgi:suppressor of ftsI